MYNDKFLLLNVIFHEDKVRGAISSRRGTALIVLNNPAHLRKLKDSFTAGSRRWFPAKLMQDMTGGDWEVMYDGCDDREPRDRETLAVSSMQKTGGGKITDPSTLQLHQSVLARKSDNLRLNAGVIAVMDVEFGPKEVCIPPERPVLLAPSHQCG